MATTKKSGAERHRQHQRRGELRLLASIIASCIDDPTYQPSIFDPDMADAFDAAMAQLKRPMRAWRGSANLAVQAGA